MLWTKPVSRKVMLRLWVRVQVCLDSGRRTGITRSLTIVVDLQMHLHRLLQAWHRLMARLTCTERKNVLKRLTGTD